MRKLVASITSLFKGQKQERIKTPDEKQELLIKLGREQFQKLLDRGLSIPVMTL